MFISILATEYRKNCVCYEIQKAGEKDSGPITIDCDRLNKTESNHKNNESDLEKFRKDKMVEIRICNHTQNSFDKCYYTKHYSKMMQDFFEQQHKKPHVTTKIVEHAEIKKYGLILCNSENQNDSAWPQFEDSGDELISGIQCKQGYLLDSNDYYEVHKPLCEMMGYTDEKGNIDYYECPQYLWHYYRSFAYVCKLFS